MRVLFLFLLLLISCSSKFTIKDAERINTIDAYYRFITENPDSPDTDQALSKIKDMLFSQAISTRDIVLIKRFISEFPADPRSQQLNDILDEIRFEEAKRKRSKTALETFLYISNNKDLKQKARDLLFEMEYNEIKDSNDTQLIEKFLIKNKNSPHFNEIQKHLANLLFEKIKNGDVYYADEFLGRFPDDIRRDEILIFLLNDVIDRLSQMCLTEGLNSLLKNCKVDQSIIYEIESKLKNNENECKTKLNTISRISSNKVKKEEIKSIFLDSKKEEEVEKTINLLRNYYQNYLKIEESIDGFDNEDFEQRRISYIYLKPYPLNPKVAFKYLELFVNSTLFERAELYDILKMMMTDENNRRLFNLIFILNREKKIYSVIRWFFFDNAEDYAKENSLLNKLYGDSREDILLQYLLIVKAYERGYNSFIKSVINEHIKQLFSTTAELQSLCVEDCPKKTLFNLKGIQIILMKEVEISKNTMGENSDIYKVIAEKEKEIAQIIKKNNFAVSQPVINNPSEQLDIGLFKNIRDKSLLRFIYRLEPDLNKRKKIRQML